MTSQADFLQPPRIAVWLVNLFTLTAEEAESIPGDLLEEFSHLASKSGVAFARSWYWRQTVKTIAHLVGSGFRVAPWSTTAAVVGGFLLVSRLSLGCPSGRSLQFFTDTRFTTIISALTYSLRRTELRLDTSSRRCSLDVSSRWRPREERWLLR